MKEWLEKKKWAMAIGLVGLIFIGIGVFVQKSGGLDKEVKVIVEQNNQVETIWVDVAGAIKNPGVYKLPKGARIISVIEASGGITSDADAEWINKNVNKAEVVSDGYKLYIPGKIAKADSTEEFGVTGVISINSASITQLDELPGIGPATATKIISGRPYIKLEDLVDRKIIGVNVWTQIKDKVSLW
jgi:competence protein ComEA